MSARHGRPKVAAAGVVAVVLSAIALGNGASAFAQGRAEHAAAPPATSAKVLLQDTREIGDLKVELERLDNSLESGLAQIRSQAASLTPAAADEVSRLTSGLFGTYAQEYQAVSAEAAALHEQFVNTLKSSGGGLRVATP